MITFLIQASIFYILKIKSNLIEYNTNMINLGEYNFDGIITMNFNTLSS